MAVGALIAELIDKNDFRTCDGRTDRCHAPGGGHSQGYYVAKRAHILAYNTIF